MVFARPVLLLVSVYSCSVLLHTVHCRNCSYLTLEHALTENKTNLEKLMLSFFPTDKPTSTVVDVHYVIRFRRDGSATDLSPLGPAIKPPPIDKISLDVTNEGDKE